MIGFEEATLIELKVGTNKYYKFVENLIDFYDKLWRKWKQ